MFKFVIADIKDCEFYELFYILHFLDLVLL